MQNACSQVIKNSRLNLPLLIYTLMNTIKNETTIPLGLN